MGQLLPHRTHTVVHHTHSWVYHNHTTNRAVSYETHGTTGTHGFIPYSPPYNLTKVCAHQLTCNAHFARCQGCFGTGGTYYEWCTCKPSCQGLVLHAGCQTVVGDPCCMSRTCTPIVHLVPVPVSCLHLWCASCACTHIMCLMPAPVLCTWTHVVCLVLAPVCQQLITMKLDEVTPWSNSRARRYQRSCLSTRVYEACENS
jgi:hypothetical protein